MLFARNFAWDVSVLCPAVIEEIELSATARPSVQTNHENLYRCMSPRDEGECSMVNATLTPLA